MLLLTGLSRLAEVAEPLPKVTASTDASGNLILATAIAGDAPYLVTGDKGHLLVLKQIEQVTIITVREALALLSNEPESD